MKKIIIGWGVVGAIFLQGNAQAVLIDRGNGLIYDEDTNLTWLQNANLAATNTFGVAGINPDGSMDWLTAQQWISAMNTANYLGYNNWRLPATDVSTLLNAGPTYDGYIYNCTDIELGHMFYVELGNQAPLTKLGVFQPGHGLNNVGPFDQLLAESYWSSTEWAGSPADTAYRMDFAEGGLDETWKLFSFPHAWAVRDGDVSPVPEPATILLFGSGLAVLARRRVKTTKQ
ncbi:Lcl domain-containing protein [Thiovibrio sp. JS02]